jgi:hypothetical protein
MSNLLSAMGDTRVKISKPAVVITAALAAVTACSSSPHVTAAKLHPRVSGVTAGPGIAAAFSKDPVCQRFQRDLKVWKSAVTEPGDASTVLLNTSTWTAWVKFGHQLGQLSHPAKGGNATPKVARTRKDLARTASLITLQGTEPFSQSTGAQYQRTVADLQYVTGDCTVFPS